MVPKAMKTSLASAWTAARAFVVRHRLWFGAGIAVLLTLAALLVWLGSSLPISRALEPLPNRAIILLDNQGGVPFARRGAYKEPPVASRRCRPMSPAAFVAIEDRRFYYHSRHRSLGRSAGRWSATARPARVREGGSTITQQLAKTSFLSPRPHLRRKAQEALIALWLEARLTKNEILSRYLSNVYFGDNVYGLRAAARHYFNAARRALTLAQAAMLAGVVNAPSRLAPTDHLARPPAPGATGARRHGRDRLSSPRPSARPARPARVRPAPRDDVPDRHLFRRLGDRRRPSELRRRGYGERRVRTTLEARPAAQRRRAVARSPAPAWCRDPGGSGRDAARRPGRRDGRRARLCAEPVQPRHPGPAPAGLGVQAVRLSRRLPRRADARTRWSATRRSRSAAGRRAITSGTIAAAITAARRLRPCPATRRRCRSSERVGRDNVIRAARDLGITSARADRRACRSASTASPCSS